MQKICILYLCSFHIRCWATSTWDLFWIQRIKECIWKEDCWHLVKTSTIWLHDWSLKNVQLPFGPIYNLSQDEPMILWQYINEILERRFFQHSKFPGGALIMFIKKDSYLQMCVDAIKNWYPLPLILGLLDHLNHTKVYIKIDLHGTYNLEHIQEGNK